MKSAYIASTQGSGGKTTISIGLCLALKRRGIEAGYFKPIGTLPAQGGEQLIDEDALFAAAVLDLSDKPADLCPVVLDERAVQSVLSGADVDAMARITAAYGRVSAGKEMVVCEGLGEIWQGRFLHTSGADVVKTLDLAALLVAKFAGARLLDDIGYVKDELQERMLGVIFNMVPEARLASVRGEYTSYLAKDGITSYGALASDAHLSAVSVGEIVAALGGTYLCGEEHADRLAETYLIGAMSPEHARRYFEVTPAKIVIVGGDRSEVVLAALDSATVGVVLTGGYVPGPAVVSKAEEVGVPLISVEGDTVVAADGMRPLFGRLRIRDAGKIDLLAGIIDQNLDLDRLVADLTHA